MNINAIAKTLDQAAVKAKPIDQISKNTQFSVDDAYAIQKSSIERRYDRGERFIGVKLGFTSKAKMEQMGVHDMIWGRLTDAMLLKRGGTLPLEKYIHPRAEPEICFLVKNKIDREVTLKEAKDFIVGVTAAIEIIDSRYRDFQFSLEDVIADNCSSAALVIGSWHPLDRSLDNLKMELEIDGNVVQSGFSEAILGNPLESLVAASRLAKQYGQVIPRGAYIMAGAATSAVYLKPGNNVKARVEGFGEVEFKVNYPEN